MGGTMSWDLLTGGEPTGDQPTNGVGKVFGRSARRGILSEGRAQEKLFA